jgi:hypothetical protein
MFYHYLVIFPYVYNFCFPNVIYFFYFIQVGNYEQHDEMPYDKAPMTEFQRFIRLGKDGKFLYCLL